MANLKNPLRALFLSIPSIILMIIFCFSDVAKADEDFSFNISTDNVYYPPGEKIGLVINSYGYNKNSSDKLKLNFTVYKIRDVNKFYSEQRFNYGVDALGINDANLISLCDKVDNFSNSFENNILYGSKGIRASVGINVKEKGAYLIKADNDKRVAYCGFVVSDLGLIVKTGLNSVLSYTVNRTNGMPVDNVDLTYYSGNKLLGTDRSINGLSQVKFDSALSIKENRYPLVIGTLGSDVVISDAELYYEYSSNEYLVYTFTQQPVYRAGAIVNFKGTIRKSSYSGLVNFAGNQIKVTAKDDNNIEIYKTELFTNENGSFDGAFTLADDAKTGSYYINVEIDENHIYSTYFTIEQYKKPEYKVSVVTDRKQYSGNDQLRGTVRADYYFGSPVTNATVNYSIYKTQYYRPWWEFSEYSWWYQDYSSSYDTRYQYNYYSEIFSGTGKLDNNGKFDFSFNLSEDFQTPKQDDHTWYYHNSETDYEYSIRAEVSDASGRHIANTGSALVTRGDFFLSAGTDKYFVKPGDKIIFNVISRDFENKPVKADFEIKINQYVSDSIVKNDLITPVKGETSIDGKGLAEYRVPENSSDGDYFAEAVSYDSKGNKITTRTYFSVYGKNYRWYDRNSEESMQIITDKESYKIGDTCHVIIMSTEPDLSALVIASTNNVLFGSSVKFTERSASVDIAITDSYTANFKIEADYIKNNSLHSAGKDVLVIPENKFLTVQIDPSKLVYKPKDTGELKVRVLDNSGNPVKNAEVSLGIVDESIYAIKEDVTSDIRKFFYPMKNSYIGTTFNSYSMSNGDSRRLAIFEKYNFSLLDDKDLATIKGTVVDENDKPIKGAEIMINREYYAAVSNAEGYFEFKIPEGVYEVGLLVKRSKEDHVAGLKVFKGQSFDVKLQYYGGDEITILGLRKGIDVEQSGRLIDNQNISTLTGQLSDEIIFNNMGIKDELVSPALRSDFRDNILWSPYTMSDEEGYAKVIVKYPDNLTTWRIVSRVITQDSKVGQSVKTVITRKELLVRLESPRFLQQGDETMIRAIVHNYLSSEKNVRVKFKSDSLSIDGEITQSANIPQNSEHTFSWKVKSINSLGSTKMYVEALTNEESDAVEVSIPVQPRGLQLNIPASADVTDMMNEKDIDIYIPEGTDMSGVTMKFNTAPSIAGTMLASLDELAGYPYGCVEQTMSRFLPSVIVANTFKELDLPLSDTLRKELPKYVNSGMERLYGLQHDDGGWGWWENDATNPFMTAWVIDGMRMAKESGYEINDDKFSRGVNSLMKMSVNSIAADTTTQLYVLYVLSSVIKSSDSTFNSSQYLKLALNDLMKGERKRIKERLDVLVKGSINSSAKSYAALAYMNINDKDNALKIVDELEAAAEVSGTLAHWEGKSWHYNWQDDKVQTTAIALKALLRIKKNSEYIDKVVRWLMIQRKGNAWRSTQETAVIIYAVTDYLKISNELNPDELVDVMLNGKNVYHAAYTEDDVYNKPGYTVVPGSELHAGMNKLSINKTGKGKVYFSSNTSYFSSDVAAKDNGFKIEREYFKLEKYAYYNEDKMVYKKQTFDGDLKTGDILFVKIKISSKGGDLDYFMLEDPIPSGCEIIKDERAYKVEDESSYDGESYYYGWRWWYADKDIRDDKINFFATRISGEQTEFTYLVRAETPGRFNINPSRGMLMYYTEVNGNSFDNYITITE